MTRPENTRVGDVTTVAPTRRDAIKAGTATIAAVVAQMSMPEFVFPGQDDDEQLVPFEGMPRTGPNSLDWETLTEWITPQDQVFSVQHYGSPEVDANDFRLEITGLVDRPMTLSLAEIKELPQHEQLMTLECSGNGVSKGFMNAIYNSKWTALPWLRY